MTREIIGELSLVTFGKLPRPQNLATCWYC